MLLFGSWIVFFAFWFYALRLARRDGLRLGLGFAALWVVARIGLPGFGIVGPFYFISFAALLTASMILIDLYREKMGLRDAPGKPLDSATEND